jgi:hypothetical protein
MVVGTSILSLPTADSSGEANKRQYRVTGGDDGAVCLGWCCLVKGENDRGHATASLLSKGEKGGATGGRLDA